MTITEFETFKRTLLTIIKTEKLSSDDKLELLRQSLEDDN